MTHSNLRHIYQRCFFRRFGGVKKQDSKTELKRTLKKIGYEKTKKFNAGLKSIEKVPKNVTRKNLDASKVDCL
jgi:hypothetical protein